MKAGDVRIFLLTVMVTALVVFTIAFGIPVYRSFADMCNQISSGACLSNPFPLMDDIIFLCVEVTFIAIIVYAAYKIVRREETSFRAP